MARRTAGVQCNILGKFPLPEKVDVRLIHVLPPLSMPVVMEPYFGGRDAYVPLHTPEEEARIEAKQEREGQALLDRTRDLLLKKELNLLPCWSAVTLPPRS
jgi:hypothetical protein